MPVPHTSLLSDIEVKQNMRESAFVESNLPADPVQEVYSPFANSTLPEMECHAGAPAPDLNMAPFVELRRTLPSQVSAISAFVDQLMRFLKPLIGKSSDVEESELDIQIALHEAIANAVTNGNREDPQKHVYVTLRYSLDGNVSIAVEDEGQGFDARALVDPMQGERRFLTHGRGIYIMRALMDEVCFEQNGKLVRMRKNLSRSRESVSGKR